MPEPQAKPLAPQTRDLRAARRELASAFVKFNLKVLAMGLLDIFLVPASVMALALGLTVGRDEPLRYFRQLTQLGRRTEHWINLFGEQNSTGLDGVLGEYEQRLAQGIAGRRGGPRTAHAARTDVDADHVDASPSAPDVEPHAAANAAAGPTQPPPPTWPSA